MSQPCASLFVINPVNPIVGSGARPSSMPTPHESTHGIKMVKVL